MNLDDFFYRNRKIIRNVRSILLVTILLFFTFIVIIPFLWMLLMSVKTTTEILLDPYGLPKNLRWQNYIDLFTDPRIKLYQYFFNSIFVTFFSLAGTTLLAALGGYGFGRKRYTFKFRGWLFGLLLFALMLPPQILYIPQFSMMSKYGLINTRWALIFLYIASELPVSTYLMSTYFSQLPTELEDAARIDGCSDWGMFWRVMLPLARPALATVTLLNFLFFWNELLLAMTMVTNPALRTLPAAIYFFVGEFRAELGMAASSLVTAMIPVLILYMVLSERFVEGMTAGALKG